MLNTRWHCQDACRRVMFATAVRFAEQANTGDSAWLPWLAAADGETHLVRELAWVGGLFEAAATEGFSLDAARPFMRAGAEFYTEERSFFVLPQLPTN